MVRKPAVAGVAGADARPPSSSMKHCLDPEEDHRTDGDVETEAGAPAQRREVDSPAIRAACPIAWAILRACRVIRPGTWKVR